MKTPAGVEAIGKEVEGIKVGDPVIVHPKISGGTCLACRRGFDMHGPGKFPGLDCNGGYSEYLCTSERNIVPLPKTLAPKDVAPYADAGLTAYRAVKKATRHLLPGESCVDIGAGGLGHIGIQCLKAMLRRRRDRGRYLRRLSGSWLARSVPTSLSRPMATRLKPYSN